MALAFLIGVLGGAQVIWATGESLGSMFWIVSGVAAGVGVFMHLAVRFLTPYADPILLPTAYLLNLIGLVMIFRLDVASGQRAAENGSPEPTPVVSSQILWLGLGAVLLAAILLVVRDHRYLQRYTYISLLVGVGLLLLPLVPGLGLTLNGANLWIKIGPYSLQPGEIAKIALSIFLAGYLVVARDGLSIVRRRVVGVSIPRGRDLGPILVAWGISLGILVFQRDLGTSLVFFGLFVSVLYIATGRRSWLIIGAGLVLIGGTVAYALFGHVRVRVNIWLDPFADASGQGFQIVQSLFGLANGGILGTGLGQGYPQLVPFANSDFIIASFGEELGMTGLFAMLLLFAILIQRGLRTATACRDTFGRLLAAGLSSVFALQVFVVVGGVTKLIPMTGLTTPFLSAGGSALVANWMMVAILIRISHDTRRPEPRLEPTGVSERP